MQDLDYIDTFIHVAPDCPLRAAAPPVARGGKKTLPLLEYEMIAPAPYTHTQPEVLFEVWRRHQGLPLTRAARKAQHEDFFSRPHACMRASALAKKYGWGLHFDHAGRVALVAMESPDYRRLAADTKLQQLYAMRSKRA
jgi:hypothetical protein